MRLLAIVLVLVLAGLAASLAYFVTGPRAIADPEALLALVSDPNERARAARIATAAGETGERITRPLPVSRRRALRSVVEIAALRAVLAWATIPLFLGALALGFALGLLRRDRLTALCGFPSVTGSYLGKMLKAFSIGAYAFTGLSPLGPPLWTLYLFALTGAIGMRYFIGNLPPKL